MHNHKKKIDVRKNLLWVCLEAGDVIHTLGMVNSGEKNYY